MGHVYIQKTLWRWHLLGRLVYTVGQQERYVHTFFSVYRGFATPDQIVALLVQAYKDNGVYTGVLCMHPVISTRPRKTEPANTPSASLSPAHMFTLLLFALGGSEGITGEGSASPRAVHKRKVSMDTAQEGAGAGVVCISRCASSEHMPYCAYIYVYIQLRNHARTTTESHLRDIAIFNYC